MGVLCLSPFETPVPLSLVFNLSGCLRKFGYPLLLGWVPSWSSRTAVVPNSPCGVELLPQGRLVGAGALGGFPCDDLVRGALVPVESRDS